LLEQLAKVRSSWAKSKGVARHCCTRPSTTRFALRSGRAGGGQALSSTSATASVIAAPSSRTFSPRRRWC